MPRVWMSFPISWGVPGTLLTAEESEAELRQASVFHSVTMCTLVYGCLFASSVTLDPVTQQTHSVLELSILFFSHKG